MTVTMGYVEPLGPDVNGAVGWSDGDGRTLGKPEDEDRHHVTCGAPVGGGGSGDAGTDTDGAVGWSTSVDGKMEKSADSEGSTVGLFNKRNKTWPPK